MNIYTDRVIGPNLILGIDLANPHSRDLTVWVISKRDEKGNLIIFNGGKLEYKDLRGYREEVEKLKNLYGTKEEFRP